MATLQGDRMLLLVDADDTAPGVAQRLALPIEPNLRTAIDACTFGLGDLSTTLQPGPGGPVLCGLPNVAAWAQMRTDDVLDVLHDLARTHDVVLADLGPSLDALDTAPRDRNDIARRVAAAADRVVLVAAAQPRGVTRALSWAADLRSLAPDTPVHGFLNFAPRDRFRRGECTDELRTAIGLSSLHAAPRDPRVDRAQWDGVSVPRSTFTRAVGELAVALLTAAPADDTVIDLTAADHGAGPVLEATA